MKQVRLVPEPLLEAMGITLLEVERRLLRAFKTDRAMPDAERRYIARLLDDGHGEVAPALRAAWPAITSDPWQSWREYNSESSRADLEEAMKRRFVPSTRDVSDWEDGPVLRWVCDAALQEAEFRVLWHMSYDDMTFAELGRRYRRSYQTVQRRYYAALHKVWGAAIQRALAERPGVAATLAGL